MTDLARLRILCAAQKDIPSPVVVVLLDRIDTLQALLRASQAGRGRWQPSTPPDRSWATMESIRGGVRAAEETGTTEDGRAS